MRPDRLILGTALALALSGAAWAQQPSAAAQAISEAAIATQAGDCATALRLTDPLAASLPEGRERTATLLIRLRCLPIAGRAAEIKPVHAELLRVAPRDPAVRSYGVLLALDENRYGDAADQLAELAASDRATLANLPGWTWQAAGQKLSEAGDQARIERTLIALAYADWQPIDRPELRETIAGGAILAHLKRGDAAAAESLLERVTMPELLTTMATERRYEPLWPAIATRLGPASATAVDSYAAARLEAHANSPGDTRARREAIRAFVLLGRFDDAGELAAPVVVETGMDEDAVSVVGYHAQALAASGDRAAAAERLRPFAQVDLAKTPAAASGVVALAQRLDENGHAEEALAVARQGRAGGDKPLSRYGLAWLARTELCALSALGRTAEARTVGDELKASAKDNEAAAVEGLLCAGRRDEAAAIAVAALSTAEGAGRLVDQFQPQGAMFGAAPSRLRDLWVPFLRRPDVAAAFAKGGRILPREFWPSPTPRAVPRLGPSSRTSV